LTIGLDVDLKSSATRCKHDGVLQADVRHVME